tara:strand:- start:415 stop:660 length:246 start_codon:yes stop_codon:yes gene_type:complete
MSLETKIPTKIDNFKFLFTQISTENKDDFYQKVADEFGLKKSSIRTGWCVRFEIPERYNVLDNLIIYTQKYIAKQNKVAQN